jgi:hypothetical protein
VIVVLVQPFGQEPLEAENAVLGGDLAAVVKARVLAELEGVGSAVGRDLPELGEGGNHPQVSIEAREPVVDLLDEHDLGLVDCLSRIERVKRIEKGIAEDPALNRAARRVVVLGEARAERVLIHQLRREGRQ